MAGEAKRAAARTRIEKQKKQAAAARAAAKAEAEDLAALKTMQLTNVMAEAEQALGGHRGGRRARSTTPGGSSTGCVPVALLLPRSTLTLPASARGHFLRCCRVPCSGGLPDRPASEEPGKSRRKKKGGGGSFATKPGGSQARRTHPFIKPNGEHTHPENSHGFVATALSKARR